jgi:uncharacterized membrane protein
VPPPDGPQAVDLAAVLLRLWPSYFGYVFSFVVIGADWANHYYMGKLYRRIDHVLNLLNLLFLMCIAFLPFPTRVLAEFIRDDANRQTAAAFYAIGLVLPRRGLAAEVAPYQPRAQADRSPARPCVRLQPDRPVRRAGVGGCRYR